MTDHQCRFCPWDCPSPEAAPCRETDHTPMAAEPCDFPAGPLPTDGSEVAKILQGRSKARRKTKTTRVIRDLSDWEDQ